MKFKLPAIFLNYDFYTKPRNRLFINKHGVVATAIIQIVWIACSQENSGKLKKSEIDGLSFPFEVEKGNLEVILNAACEVGLLEQDSTSYFNSQILSNKKSYDEKRANYSNARKKVIKTKKLECEDSKRILGESSENPTIYIPIPISIPIDINNKEIAKAESAPIWKECEFLKMTTDEARKVLASYQKNKYPLELLPFATQVLDEWLGSTTKEALKARKQETHYRRLTASWVLEKAQKLYRVANKPADGIPQKLTSYEKAVQLAKKREQEKNGYFGDRPISDLPNSHVSQNGSERSDIASLPRTLCGKNGSGNETSDLLVRKELKEPVATIDTRITRSPESDNKNAASEIVSSLTRTIGTIKGGKAETDRGT